MFDRVQKLAWEEEHKKTRWKGPFSIEPILEQLKKDDRILDAGCGKGRYLIPLLRKGYKVTGCDLALSALRELKQRDAEVAVCEISKLPFKASAFEAVLCYGVLQHLLEEERKIAVGEMRRVMKPGGLLFLEVLGREDMRYGASGEELEKNTFRRKNDILYHYFTSQEIRVILREFDFEIMKLEERKTEKHFKSRRYARHFIFAIARAAPPEL